MCISSRCSTSHKWIWESVPSGKVVRYCAAVAGFPLCIPLEMRLRILLIKPWTESSCTFLKQYISPSIEVSLKVADLAGGNDCHTFLMGTVTLTPRVLRAVPGNPLTLQSPVKKKQRTKLNYSCQVSFTVKHTALERSSGELASSSSRYELVR